MHKLLIKIAKIMIKIKTKLHKIAERIKRSQNTRFKSDFAIFDYITKDTKRLIASSF